VNDQGVLSEAHLSMLRDASCISETVIAARGYRTVTISKDLADLGFPPRQRRVPALLLPLHTTDGQIGLYILRPDNPRTVQMTDGKTKTIKYEAPTGMGARLDCPPVCQPMLGDPAIPLWVTEGQKKADSLATQRLCAIALMGVWNWKSRNDVGGNVFSADWDYIALTGRDVRIVFDSDVMTKTSVRQALDRLSEHLGRKGAHVSAVYLPNSPNGGKLGVDDYLAGGHTVAELETLVEGPRPTPKASAPAVDLLDVPPDAMRRPLCIIGRHAYATAWLPCRVTMHERQDKNGDVVTLNPPEVRNEIRLFVVRDDGALFGDGGDQPLESLGFDVLLSEIPRNEKTLSTVAVKAYRAGQRPDPLVVFDHVRDVVDRFIDFDRSLADQRTMTEMLACYALASWFLDAFNVIGFLWPNGDRGTGKTHLLLVVTELSYLGQFTTSGGSFAALRDLADYGALIAFDDAENVNDARRFDPDKRALLLAGNRRGAAVPLKEAVGLREWRTRWVDAFCPRLFSAIRMPDAVLASRTIVVPLIRTSDRARANTDPLDFEKWPHDRRALTNDLWCLALAHLRELQDYDRQVADHASLSGRNLQPWRAILAVARWIDDRGGSGVFGRLDALSVAYQTERPDLELSDATVLVLKGLKALVSDVSDVWDVSDVKHVDCVFTFTTKLVREKVDELAEQAEIDLSWMGEALSRSKRIGRILSALRFPKADTSKARQWRVKTDQLDRLLVSYGILIPEQSVAIPLTSQTSVTSQTSRVPPPSTDGNKPDHACRVGASHRTFWKRDGEMTWKCMVCHPTASPHIERYTVPEQNA